METSNGEFESTTSLRAIWQKDAVVILRYGLEMWKGLVKSVRIQLDNSV